MRGIQEGNFGKLSKEYVMGRREYPSAVFDYLRSLQDLAVSKILDLGCGTGIATRQIAARGWNVVGFDKDEEMIHRAQEIPDPSIRYVVAPAEHLPFRDGEFNVVTAFGAFHWFANTLAIREIQRVLVPRGGFFVVNKNEVDDFREGYRGVFEKTLNISLPNVKQDYRPIELLKEHGFLNVTSKAFSISEFFTIQEAFLYIQSVSVWNLVSEGMRSKVLSDLGDYWQKRFPDGEVERKLNVVVVWGEKTRV